MATPEEKLEEIISDLLPSSASIMRQVTVMSGVRALIKEIKGEAKKKKRTRAKCQEEMDFERLQGILLVVFNGEFSGEKDKEWLIRKCVGRCSNKMLSTLLETKGDSTDE